LVTLPGGGWRDRWPSSIHVFALYVFFRADSLIFLPPPPSYPDTEAVLKLPVNGDEVIAARYLPNPAADYTLLFIHGNAEDLGDLRFFLEESASTGALASLPTTIAAMASATVPPANGTPIEDTEAAYRYLTEILQVPPNRFWSMAVR
jgi:hypothetical protein